MRIVERGDLHPGRDARRRGLAISARPSSCHRPITSLTRSTSTATATATWCTALPDVLASTANYLQGLWLAAAACAGTRRSELRGDPRLEQRPWSTPRRSRPLPSRLEVARPVPKTLGADRFLKPSNPTPGHGCPKDGVAFTRLWPGDFLFPHVPAAAILQSAWLTGRGANTGFQKPAFHDRPPPNKRSPPRCRLRSR